MQFQRFLAFCVRVLFVSVVSLPLAAQWTNVAPNLLGSIGNEIELGSITAKSGIIWAGIHDVWMSSDSGLTWTKRSPRPLYSNDRIKVIHFYDEKVGAIVTHHGYIFLTRDQGLTWQEQNIRMSSGTGVAILSPPENIIASGGAGEVFITHDGGINWKAIKVGTYVADVRPLLGSSAYILKVFTPPGDTSEMHVMRTTDYGETWTMQPGILDVDTYSFDVDPCNPSVIYVANEDGITTRDSLCQVFRSTDFGMSWQSLGERSNKKGRPRHYYSGSISLAPSGLFVQTVSDGIQRSTDMGMTWQNIGGPSVTYDTRLLCAVSGNLIIAADNNGSIWRTGNSGGDSLAIGSQYELLSSFPKELFVPDSLRVCDSPVVSAIYLFSSFCRTPRIVGQEITGTDSLDYRLLAGVGDSLTGIDSVVISFKPSSAGDKRGYYTITLEDGTKLSFPLKGYGRGLKFVGSATLDAATDTIGGYVSVPLTFIGLDRPQDIGMVVHYDPELIYLGSFTNDGVRIDVPGETWKEGSRIVIEGEKLRLDSASGFSYFAVYPRRGEWCYSVAFDSLTILDVNSKCEYVLGAGIEAKICPPRGCGIMIITDYLLHGAVPDLLLQPNPTSGKLSIIAQDSLGLCTLHIVDNTGRSVYRDEIVLDSGMRYPIDLGQFAEGLYFATITASAGTVHQKIRIIK